MIPPAFDDHAPKTVGKGLSLRGTLGGDAMLLAGGHSLLPMMKLRFAEPAHLIDLNRIPELRGISAEHGNVAIGATAVENDLIASPLLQAKGPLLAEAATLIADPQVRNRGTMGGDIAHGDPANDLPALNLASVIAVLTADDLEPLELHRMPTVAVVVADDRSAAPDGVEAVIVECEELSIVTDPRAAVEPGAPVVRGDLAGKTSRARRPGDHHNHIFTWDAGGEAAAGAAIAAAPVIVQEHILYPRVQPCPLETCSCVARFNPVRGELAPYITSQAPHILRTVVSLPSGIPESRMRIISPDIGGGFGNKLGIDPG